MSNINAAVRNAVLKRDDHRCRKCSRPCPLDAHHITPRAKGGGDTHDNLVALCQPCHTEWHMVEQAYNLSFEEWLLVPTYDVLLAAYRSIPDELRRLVDVVWDVRRVGD